MEYDEAKFEELLVYVASRLQGDPTGGAVKLNKAIYYAEFGHMRTTGRPISGVPFQKLQWGPAPRRLLPVRQALVDRDEAVIETVTYLGFSQDRLIPTRPADTSVFSEDELQCIEQAIAALEGMSATEVSSRSHEELGWLMVEDGETIPYETAFLRQPVLTRKIRERGEQLASELGLL